MSAEDYDYENPYEERYQQAVSIVEDAIKSQCGLINCAHLTQAKAAVDALISIGWSLGAYG